MKFTLIKVPMGGEGAPPKPQITSTGTDFPGNKAYFLGKKAASADVVGGGS